MESRVASVDDPEARFGMLGISNFMIGDLVDRGEHLPNIRRSCDERICLYVVRSLEIGKKPGTPARRRRRQP